jgi:hypothetical protein
MKNWILYFLLFFLFPNINSQSKTYQKLSREERYNLTLKAYDLSYSLPKGYIETDTSLMGKNFRLFQLNYMTNFQMGSINGNVMIYPFFIPYNKNTEDKLRRLYPKSNISLKNEYLNVIRHLVSQNTNQPRDSISLNDVDIVLYSKSILRRLGADIAGYYTMKLAQPFKGEYNFLTFRFIGKDYKVWNLTYIFYKECNQVTAKKTLKETLYLFKFNN